MSKPSKNDGKFNKQWAFKEALQKIVPVANSDTTAETLLEMLAHYQKEDFTQVEIVDKINDYLKENDYKKFTTLSSNYFVNKKFNEFERKSLINLIRVMLAFEARFY